MTVEWSLAEKKYEKAFNEELVKKAKEILKDKPNSTVTEEDLQKYSAKHVESKEAREMWDEHQKKLRANQKKKSAPSGSSF